MLTKLAIYNAWTENCTTDGCGGLSQLLGGLEGNHVPLPCSCVLLALSGEPESGIQEAAGSLK